jgi:1-acyl-sn-glycerol-3-phosphate acyltransferase
MIGTDEIQPTDAKLPRLFRTVRIRFGEPLALDRYARAADDRMVLRQITDELMFEIAQLSGYQYVDTYATKKAEDLPTEPLRLATFDPAAMAGAPEQVGAVA